MFNCFISKRIKKNLNYNLYYSRMVNSNLKKEQVKKPTSQIKPSLKSPEKIQTKKPIISTKIPQVKEQPKKVLLKKNSVKEQPIPVKKPIIKTLNNIARIKTGIQGFDELIEGGFPDQSDTVVCGSFGSGKTIFGLHFIYNGITKYNENGVIVTFEVKKQNLVDQAKMFGWDLEKLEREKKLKILYFDVLNLSSVLFEQIRAAIPEIGAKRLLFDSLNDLTINIGKNNRSASGSVSEKYSTEQFVYYTIHKLRSLNISTLFISSSLEGEEYITRDTVSEYLCDNVIWLKFQSMGGPFSRTLVVRKARRTKNSEDVHPVEISEKGLTVHRLE